jgi:hypothetical protein
MRPSLGSDAMLTPKVTCLSTLPSAHASRGAGGASVAAFARAAKH